MKSLNLVEIEFTIIIHIETMLPINSINMNKFRMAYNKKGLTKSENYTQCCQHDSFTSDNII